jgi:O-antigen ligase
LPSIGHAYFATFVAVQLPALCLVARRLSATFTAERRGQLLMALMLWLGLSVLWSTFARHSLPEFVSLFLTTTFGIYLTTSFAPAMFWRIVALAMSIGLTLSLLAIERGWDAAVNSEDGYWIGIYYNRNSFAPVVAVILISLIGILCTQQIWKNSDGLIVLAATVALSFGAVFTLWRTESRTSPLALLVAVLGLAPWLGLRWIFLRMFRGARKFAAGISVVLMAISVFFGLRIIGGLSSVSGETATFNSRGQLWTLSWSGFLDKPLHGWGWMAAWRTLKFFQQGEWWAVWDTEWSHNGYHDLLLGGGVLAAVLFAGVVWFGMQEIGSHIALKNGIPYFLLVVFVLIAATQESFFIGSHFLWALLIAGLFLPRHRQETRNKELTN